MKNLKGSLILLLTAMAWGMGFVAQSEGADRIGSFTFSGARSLLAAPALLLLAWVLYARKRRLHPADTRPHFFSRDILIAGGVCGLFLCIAMNLQQFGIAVYPDGVASSGRASFLTATYVVMVAVVSGLTRRHLPPLLYVASVGCLAGMYLLCLSGGLSGLYLGDLLELLCAVGYTVHIFVIDRYSHLDTVLVSAVQFAVVGVLSLICALVFETVSVSDLQSATVPILYAGLISGAVGYTLQMVGQKFAIPPVASIVMSLESVFGALAGWLILSERLSPVELLGCGLVFASVILAQVESFRPGKAASGNGE